MIPPGADNPAPSGDEGEPTSLISPHRPYAVSQFGFFIEEFVHESIRKREEPVKLEAEKPADSPQREDDEAETPDEEESPKTVHWKDTQRFQWVPLGMGADVASTERTIGLIVFYADDRRYDIPKLQGLVEEAIDLLAKDNRLNKSRFEIKFGGYREDANVEFWILGQSESYPPLKPDERCKETDPDGK